MVYSLFIFWNDAEDKGTIEAMSFQEKLLKTIYDIALLPSKKKKKYRAHDMGKKRK